MSAAKMTLAVWPEAVTDGLTLPCGDCGVVPEFDYRVADWFWDAWVEGDDRLGVICLPCLNKRSDGWDLGEALIEVQWTGRGHTVVLTPTARYEYPPLTDEQVARIEAAR